MIEAADEDTSTGRLLAHSSGNINSEILTGAVSALVLAGLALPSLELMPLLTWLGITLILTALRFATTRSLNSDSLDGNQFSGSQRNLFLGGLILTAFAWSGLPLLASMTGSTSLLSFSLFWVFCLAALIATCYPGVLLASLPFFLIAALPAAVMSLQQGISMTQLLPIIATLLGGLSLTLLNRLSRRNHLQLLHAEQDLSVLTKHLDTRKQQIDKLTVGLKTNAEKREEAEAELRRTAADLGLVRSKAKALADALQRVTPHDSVTGISNEHHFQETLEREWRRVMRERKPITVLYLDIDFYDLYHESYGSQTSDHTLTRIAKLVASTGKRSTDVAARIEDGKFKLLLPGADTKNGARLAEHLRSQVEGLRIPFKNSPLGETLTISVGVSSMIPNPTSDMNALNERARDALYEAGFRGGNKTVTFKAISDVKVERWDVKVEGPLSVDGMVRKLSILGYKGERKVMKPGNYLADESFESDLGIAVLTGQLKVVVDGEAVLLKHGDIMLLPAGTPRSMEVEGNKETHYLEAMKSG